MLAGVQTYCQKHLAPEVLPLLIGDWQLPPELWRALGVRVHLFFLRSFYSCSSLQEYFVGEAAFTMVEPPPIPLDPSFPEGLSLFPFLMAAERTVFPENVLKSFSQPSLVRRSSSFLCFHSYL